MLIHRFIQISIGFLLAFLISWTARTFQFLTIKGMWTATLIGGILFASGQWAWSILIVMFFVSSSVLSIINTRLQPHHPASSFKNGLRDWKQVAANGGLSAALAMVSTLNSEWIWPTIAYTGAMAAVTADTWATELGGLSPTQPRLITTWEKVPPGTSGGITLFGTLAALAGSGAIALISILVFPEFFFLKPLVLLIIAGATSSLFDSLLGATLQGMYRCPTCDLITEQHPSHHCQTPTRHIRGWTWLNNDAVNFLASLVGASLMLILW